MTEVIELPDKDIKTAVIIMFKYIEERASQVTLVVNPPCQCRGLKRLRFDHRWARSPGEGSGTPLYSCLENSMDRGAWQTIVHRVAKSWTRLKRLSTYKRKYEHIN